MSADTGTVRLSIADGVAAVVFDRPQAHNAMTWSMYETLGAICEQLAADASVRVVTLRGAGGKAFVAGTDIAQFQSFASAEDGIAYESGIDAGIERLERLPMPVVAILEGWVVGGGLAIAAACDLRIATPDAQFGVPIARTLGNCLSMASISRLTALIGPARVKDLIFSARLVGAEEAFHIGLLTEVVEDLDALNKRAGELAATVAATAPLTLAASKQALARLMRRLTREEGEDLILMCYMSRDFREGMDAFLNKRAPHWSGE